MRNSQFQFLTGAAVCFLFLSLLGCDSERITAQIETICNSGETIECTCDDGSTRQKVCLDHGLGYEDCPCEDKVAEDSDTEDDTVDISPEDTDSQTDFGETEQPDSETDSMTDAPSGTDQEGTKPDVGDECDENTACTDDLSCFAGHCMDNLGSFQWGDELGDRVEALAIDSQDAIYVAGTREEHKPEASDPNDSKLQKIFLMKLSPAGSPIWTKEFGGAGTLNSVSDMIVDQENNIYVVGQTRESLDGQTDLGYRLGFMYIAKYAPSGERQWLSMSSMDNGNTRTNGASGVDLDASGNPWVSGTIVNNKMFVAKFSKVDGEQLSVAELTANNTVSYGKDLVVDKESGAIYLTGVDDRNAVLYKLDEQGEEVWREEWKSLNDKNDVPEALTIGVDGELYIVGNSEVEEAYDGACGISICTDVFVTKIGAELGRVKWTTRLDQFPTVDSGLAILAHPNGKIYITGGMFSDIVLLPFETEAAWHMVANTDYYAWPRLYLEDTGGSAPGGGLSGIGRPRDFLYDTGDVPGAGIVHGLYNKQGSRWELVAAENGAGGEGTLHYGAVSPELTIGDLFDFYYHLDALEVYEKAPYSRADLVHFASGDSPTSLFDPNDYSEQGNALAVDSKGNIFIAGQTFGDFMYGSNGAASHNTTDSLLIKYVP